MHAKIACVIYKNFETQESVHKTKTMNSINGKEDEKISLEMVWICMVVYRRPKTGLVYNHNYRSMASSGKNKNSKDNSKKGIQQYL